MNRPHRAWLVCLGGALTLLSTIGLGVNVFAVYQPEILALRHFTNAQGSLITTVRSLFILVALLTVNRVCARLGLRRTMTLGVLLIALSCFCFGAARAFWQYCAAAVFTGLGYCYGGMVPLSLLIGRWFRARRNLALGLASAGSGVASIVASPLVVRVIEGRGLQAAFWLEGAALVVLAGVVWLLVRSDPAQLGLEPLGGAAPETDAPRSRSSSGPPAYLAAMAACFLIGGIGGPGYSHLTVHYATLGYAPLFLAGLVSASGVGVCVGKVLCGQIYDRWGSVAGDGYCYLSGLAGTLLCCLPVRENPLVPVLAVGLFSLGLPISAVSPSVWAAELARPDDFPRAVQAINLAYAVGVILFGPVPGLLADWTGSYIPAYLLFAALLTLAVALVRLAYARKKRLTV